MIYRCITKKLINLGCYALARKGGGTHRKWHNPATNLTTVVPDQGSRDLPTGTVRGIVRQLGLSWADFQQA